MQTNFVLIHGPLASPLTWTLVARELERIGVEVVTPILPGVRYASPPFWSQHAFGVVRALESIASADPPVLVGHSGAGVLLPAIRETLDRPVAGYILVDADIPRDGASRLDLFDSQEQAERFRRSAKGGMLPVWSDEDLRGVIPDDGVRRRFVEESRPLPLAVYEEPLPVFARWPDAPCGYLKLSATYEASFQEAQGRAWVCAGLDAGHFHMLAAPSTVADELVKLAERMWARSV